MFDESSAQHVIFRVECCAHAGAMLLITLRPMLICSSVHLMAVGNSIINQTVRSGWNGKLQEAYPKAKITSAVYVRGGGNCGHFKEDGRVEKVVVAAKPDRFYIVGISQRNIKRMREGITRIRAALPEAEFLLTPGAFGITDA